MLYHIDDNGVVIDNVINNIDPGPPFLGLLCVRHSHSKMNTNSSKEMPLHRINSSVYAPLKDVAKLAGVSTKTVSRGVNHQGELKRTPLEPVV